MKYLCRHLKPFPSEYKLVEGKTKADAAQNFHMIGIEGISLQDGSGAIFSIVEVDDTKFISRIFYGGIGRIGGVKSPKRDWQANSLEEVAEKLDISINSLVENEWEGEEQEWTWISPRRNF